MTGASSLTTLLDLLLSRMMQADKKARDKRADNRENK